MVSKLDFETFLIIFTLTFPPFLPLANDILIIIFIIHAKWPPSKAKQLLKKYVVKKQTNPLVRFLVHLLSPQNSGSGYE